MKVTATLRVMGEIDALRTAVVLAMERLCFASAESFTDEIPPDDAIYARVGFDGPKHGEVVIALPRAALAELVARVLPPDMIDSTISDEDVVAELANIVCGNVVPRIYGREEIYALAIPVLGRAHTPELARTIVHFDLGWVAASLHGEAP